MHRISFCLVTSLMALGCLAAPAPATRGVTSVQPNVPQRAGFDAAQSAGIFIGVGSFPTSEELTQEPLAAIPYAVNDAVDLAHLFTLKLRLVDAENVRLVLSDLPTEDETAKRLDELLREGARRYDARQAEIYALLDKTVHAAGPEGLLIVTFATHGFTTPNGQRLLASDSLLRFAEETGVSAQRLFHLVASEAETPRRVFLLDACRELLTSARSASGVADDRSAASPKLAAAIARSEGEVILFAARPKGFAYDDKETKNGVFTASILDGLSCGSETDENGLITARLLASYVNRAVRKWVQDHHAARPGVPLGIEYQLGGEGADLPLAECPLRTVSAPGRPPEFPYLVPDAPVTAGTTLDVEGEVLFDCGRGDFWLAFIDRDNFVWPALQVRNREFRHSVALPLRFTGGELALVCVARETSRNYKDWLAAGNQSPLTSPGELKIFLASPLTIQR